MGKDEKQKRWTQARPSSSLSGGNSSPCSALMQQALIFWPLRLLVLRAVAMLCPVRLYAVEVGRYGCLDLRREGLGGIVVITSVVVEVWMPSWWNNGDHVGSGRGSRAPVDYAWSRPSHRWERVPRLGEPVAPCLARGFHVSLGRGRSELKGSDALMTSWGSGEAKKCRPGRPSRPRPLRKAWVGWSLSFVPQATDTLSVHLASRFCWGSYDGALAVVQGAVFYHLLGTLVF
jgi:hypothetical protein